MCVSLKAFRFAILLAQVKTCLFEVMSLYSNALIYSWEPVFKA